MLLMIFSCNHIARILRPLHSTMRDSDQIHGVSHSGHPWSTSNFGFLFHPFALHFLLILPFAALMLVCSFPEHLRPKAFTPPRYPLKIPRNSVVRYVLRSLCFIAVYV